MRAYAIVGTDIKDPDAFALYVDLAGKAVHKFGGEFLVRTTEMTLKEGSSRARTTVVRFPDMETAEAFYTSDDYKAAMAHLDAGAVRDYKLVPGV